MTSSEANGRDRRTIVSRAVVLCLALVSAFFVLRTLSIMWTGWISNFPIGIDPSTAIVDGIDPKAGAGVIRVGDRLDLEAMPFRDRRYLYDVIVKEPGARMTVSTVRGGRRFSKTLAVTSFRPGFDEAVTAFSRKIFALIMILTGVLLVWSRPTVMLWGLAVFLIRTHDWLIGSFGTPAEAALQIAAYTFVFSLGTPGLIVFAARFPDGHAGKSTKYWDLFAAAVFVYYVVTVAHDFVPLFTARPLADLSPDPAYVDDGLYVLIFAGLCVRLIVKRKSIRSGFEWIAAGYGVGILGGYVGLNTLFNNTVGYDGVWQEFAQRLIVLLFPASVLYSVIRHRAFALGYWANRAIVYAGLSIALVSTLYITIWATSFQLSSTLGVGAAMFCALVVGIVFQANVGRFERFVDRIFIPHRYQTAVSLDALRDAPPADVGALADELVAALDLSSIAVFSRVSDGGFVRKTAIGWPPGTAWHLLPGEALTESIEGGATIVSLPAGGGAVTLPEAHARPCVAVTVRRSGRVERAILVGPHRNGNAPDRDSIRSLQRLFEAARVA